MPAATALAKAHDAELVGIHVQDSMSVYEAAYPMIQPLVGESHLELLAESRVLSWRRTSVCMADVAAAHPHA
ncbi:hypothetical protein CEY04_08955 [Achromobacter sp. HZ28]|nr:hypothetical protein CEY05_19035 [Achromobacter sp. HZ34]OWT79147.1 hypothetical protein CEY04_08955 [Achromobacter sp. HZ28]